MQNIQETPQEYYDRTNQLMDAINTPSANQLVDAQKRPYINGVSQGPAYFIKPDGSLIDANDPARSSIYPDMPQENFLKTISPALLGAAGGVGLGLLGGAGGGALSAAGGEALGAGASGLGATGLGGSALGLNNALAGSTGYTAPSAAGTSTMLQNGLSGAGTAATVAGSGSGLAPSGNTTFGIPNNVLGGVAQGALGLLGANAQGNAYQDVANQYLNIGAPYRGQLDASYKPGFNLMDQPGYGDAFNRSADIAARSYSAKMGNPADNPTAQAGILSDVWNQSYLPALSNYRGQLGQFGGLGLNTSGTASMTGAGSTGDAYNAVGAGLNTALNPPTDIATLLKQLGTTGGSNYSLNIGGMKA